MRRERPSDVEPRSWQNRRNRERLTQLPSMYHPVKEVGTLGSHLHLFVNNMVYISNHYDATTVQSNEHNNYIAPDRIQTYHNVHVYVVLIKKLKIWFEKNHLVLVI